MGDAVPQLLFAFVGVEVALIPSGEVKQSARTVPRSIYLSLAITTTLYLLIQLVAQGTLGPELAANDKTPLAEKRRHNFSAVSVTLSWWWAQPFPLLALSPVIF